MSFGKWQQDFLWAGTRQSLGAGRLPLCPTLACLAKLWTFLERWKVKGQSIQHRVNKISSWKQRKGQLWNEKATTNPPQYFLILLGQWWPTECAVRAQELLLRAGGTEQHCWMHSVSADGFLNLLFTALWLEGQHELVWQDGSDRGRLTSKRPVCTKCKENKDCRLCVCLLPSHEKNIFLALPIFFSFNICWNTSPSS